MLPGRFRQSCAIGTYRITDPKFNDVPESVAILYGDEQLEFTDSVGDWKRTSAAGLRAMVANEPKLNPTWQLKEDVTKRSEVEDCGEGG